MGSVFGYLFIAAMIIFALIVVAVFLSIAVRFIGIAIFRGGRWFARESIKNARELAIETWKAIQEVRQKKGLKNLSNDSSVLLIVWGAVIAALATYFSMYFGIENIGVAISAMAATSVAYFTIFIYIFSVEIKIGGEKGIEKMALVSILSIVGSVIFFIWSNNVDRLDSISATATVIAAGIALFALTIGFLNYKRKSGVAIECYFDLIPNKGSYFYFSNLKDRPLVIYDFIIESLNLEYYANLKSPIVVPSYGLKLYEITDVSSLFTDMSDSKGINGCILDEKNLNEILIEMRYELLAGNYKIRANTNFGEKYFIIKSEGVSMKDAAIISKKGKIVLHTHFDIEKSNSSINKNDIFKLDRISFPSKKYKTVQLPDSEKASVLSILQKKQIDNVSEEDINTIFKNLFKQ